MEHMLCLFTLQVYLVRRQSTIAIVSHLTVHQPHLQES